MDAKNLTAADKNQTAEDYLKTERAGATKREFFDGKILANSSSNRANKLFARFDDELAKIFPSKNSLLVAPARSVFR